MSKRVILLIIGALSAASVSASAGGGIIPSPEQSVAPGRASSFATGVASTYGQLPLIFERNRGQLDAQVRWMARGRGYTLFLTEQESVLALHSQAGTIPMKLAGSRAWSSGEGLERTGGVSNYFVGNSPDYWKTGISHYRRIRFAEVHDGITLDFCGGASGLEFDLVVAPGADPTQIRLAYDGVSTSRLDPTGELALRTSSGAGVRQLRPRVYQEVGGQEVEVAGAAYVTGSTRSVNFPIDDALQADRLYQFGTSGDVPVVGRW